VRTIHRDLAKVGVEGSNPFARSRFLLMAKFDESPLCQRAFRFPNVTLRHKPIAFRVLTAAARFLVPDPDAIDFCDPRIRRRGGTVHANPELKPQRASMTARVCKSCSPSLGPSDVASDRMAPNPRDIIIT
jgi:hypothetical protein